MGNDFKYYVNANQKQSNNKRPLKFYAIDSIVKMYKEQGTHDHLTDDELYEQAKLIYKTIDSLNSKEHYNNRKFAQGNILVDQFHEHIFIDNHKTKHATKLY